MAVISRTMTRTVGFGAGGGLVGQCSQLPALLGGRVGSEAAPDGLAVHRQARRRALRRRG
jgi:hypothetical protein